jgi:hypothetical protein
MAESAIVLSNELTGEAHGFSSVAAMIGVLPYFDFSRWKPGVYFIENNASGSIPVLLFGVTYTVNVGEVWKFIAHPEIGSYHFVTAGTKIVAAPSVWDGGASIWDSGQSIWDVP